MALADYGFDTTVEGPIQGPPIVQSLDESTTRTGYALRASAAAAGLRTRFSRMVLSGALTGMGVFLFLKGDAVVSADAAGAWLLTPIALYLMAFGLFWTSMLLRRPQELKVDQRNRCFHLIKRNLRGKARMRETIRFEEVVNISMIDNLTSLDMRANAMNWSMGRIDITWRKDQVSPMIIGDVAELEPLLRRLRREVGMA